MPILIAEISLHSEIFTMYNKMLYNRLESCITKVSLFLSIFRIVIKQGNKKCYFIIQFPLYMHCINCGFYFMSAFYHSIKNVPLTRAFVLPNAILAGTATWNAAVPLIYSGMFCGTAF